MKIYFINIS